MSGVTTSFALRLMLEGDATSGVTLSFFVRRVLEGDEMSGVLDFCFALGEVSTVASLALFF